MENFPITTTIHTAPPAVSAANPSFAIHSLTDVALNTILSTIITSSKYGRGLSWFSLNDFVSLSSTHKILHINSQQIWKNLLIDQNHGCLREEALFNPALFKTVYLQLNRFGISFETPQLVYMVASRGFVEMMGIFNANGNPILPEVYEYLKYSPGMIEVLNMPSDPKNANFVAALSNCISQIQKICTESGWTALMFAAKTRDANLVRALLAYKRRTDSEHYKEYLEANRLGHEMSQETALMQAIKGDWNFAFSKHYDLEYDIIRSCESGTLETVRMLIENKADIEARDVCGHTPLILATKNTQIEIVRLLLEARANAKATDYFGYSTLTHALRVKDDLHYKIRDINRRAAALKIQSEIVDLLERNGGRV